MKILLFLIMYEKMKKKQNWKLVYKLFDNEHGKCLVISCNAFIEDDATLNITRMKSCIEWRRNDFLINHSTLQWQLIWAHENKKKWDFKSDYARYTKIVFLFFLIKQSRLKEERAFM